MSTKVEDKFKSFQAASNKLASTVDRYDAKGFVTAESQARLTEWQRNTAVAGLGYVQAIGDLVVTGLDEYIRGVAISEKIARKHDLVMVILTAAIGLFTLVSAASTAIQGYYYYHLLTQQSAPINSAATSKP